MYFIGLALIGVISGVLGGMGMGGGTLLIPLLTLIFGFSQRLSQSINLISFSVMALGIVFFHIKNKLINIKTALVFAFFSIPACVIGAILTKIIHGQYLRMFYGVLLILIASFQVFTKLKQKNILKAQKK